MKFKQLIVALIVAISLIGCSNEKVTMQDNLRSIANICMKTDIDTSGLTVDYSELHKALSKYDKVIEKETIESVYMSLSYLKTYNIQNVSSQSAYSAKEYNDLGKNYWELDCIGVADGLQGRVVLQLEINEKGKIISCIVKSQQIVKLES